MKPHPNNPSYLFVPVPEGAENVTILGSQLNYSIKGVLTFAPLTIALPPGNYQLISRCDLLSEDGWAEVVERTRVECKHVPSDKYPNYMSKSMRFNYATESGHSLPTSLDLKPETTYLLKKID